LTDTLSIDQEILDLYSKRAEQNKELHRTLERVSRRYSLVRLLLALATVLALVIGLWDLSHVKTWALGLCGLTVIGYLLVARLHDRVIRQSKRHRELFEINAEARSRLERKWDSVPASTVPADIADHPLARDLDLFHREETRASLVRLLGRPRTRTGQAVLYDWLLNPADPRTVRERQAAVLELAPGLDWRQELELTGKNLLKKPHNPDPFLKWAESEPWLIFPPKSSPKKC